MKLLNDTIINNINDLVLQNPDLHIDIQDISLVLNSKLESENLYKFEGSICGNYFGTKVAISDIKTFLASLNDLVTINSKSKSK